MSKVKETLSKVRNFEADAVKHLEPHEYREYLEYRVSDADGWQMYLDEEDDEE